MDLITGILIWMGGAIIAGIIAERKGRSRAGLFLLSLVISPLFGIIIALVLSPDRGQLERQQIDSGASKRCPHCAEIIRAEATVCRYCGRDLATRSIAAAPFLAPLPDEPEPVKRRD